MPSVLHKVVERNHCLASGVALASLAWAVAVVVVAHSMIEDSQLDKILVDTVVGSSAAVEG